MYIHAHLLWTVYMYFWCQMIEICWSWKDESWNWYRDGVHSHDRILTNSSCPSGFWNPNPLVPFIFGTKVTLPIEKIPVPLIFLSTKYTLFWFCKPKFLSWFLEQKSQVPFSYVLINIKAYLCIYSIYTV